MWQIQGGICHFLCKIAEKRRKTGIKSMKIGTELVGRTLKTAFDWAIFSQLSRIA